LSKLDTASLAVMWSKELLWNLDLHPSRTFMEK
jgi:hypothetical protein